MVAQIQEEERIMGDSKSFAW